MNEKLDLQSLNSEYTKWISENGMGRNSSDQRFGQYIHNNYDLSFLGYGMDKNKDFIDYNDAFYEEKANNSLDILTNLILKQ